MKFNNIHILFLILTGVAATAVAEENGSRRNSIRFSEREEEEESEIEGEREERRKRDIQNMAQIEREERMEIQADLVERGREKNLSLHDSFSSVGVERGEAEEVKEERRRMVYRSKRRSGGGQQQFQTPRLFNIGAVLSSDQHVDFLHRQIKDAESRLSSWNIELKAHTVAMNANPIRTAQLVCDLISKQVYTVIVSHPASSETSPASVSFTCGFYDIPVIGISNRDSSLSNKNLHASFMRTISPYSHQATVWIHILQQLGYNSVIFIHSSDNDGLTTLDRFQNMADDVKIKVDMVVEYEPGVTNIVKDLNDTKQETATRVFILYANTEDAEMIFSEIELLQMSTTGYVWIVSEQALQAKNKPVGLIGLRLKNGQNEVAHIRDSVTIFTSSLIELLQKEEKQTMSGRGSTNADEDRDGDKDLYEITSPPADCGKQAEKWQTGIELLKLFKNQMFTNGSTGRIKFDSSGDRLDSDYDVVNVLGNEVIATVGNYYYSESESRMKLELDENRITWPGNTKNKPRGYYVATHLKVVTIEEKPFVLIRSPFQNGTCPEPMLPCPKKVRNVHSGKEGSELFCCEGYCIELLKALSERLNFTFDLYQVTDSSYGSFEYSDSGKKVWNGIVGDLVSKTADLSVAPLTINPSRAKAIDFSKPFKFQGIAMIQKKKPKKAKLESFLQPFRDELWLLVFCCVFVVAAALYVLDRYSPFGKNMMKDQSLTNEKSLNFSSAIWFSFGVLLNSGIGEKTPMSFSARVLGMVWAGFSMIVVASYTANLAAWLVLDTTETEITGLDDSRLRNPVEGFKYGTVKGSYVDMYFKGQVELSNMYRLMEENNVRTAEEALQLIKSGDLNVFFWDSPRLEFEAAADCNLIISGETFARSGYGLGLQKNSFWSERVTLQLLEMHESGFMEKLDNDWILKPQESAHCASNKADDFQTTLGLETMSAVFFLVAGGFISGLVLIVIEVSYKRRKIRKLRQIVAAKKCAIKWLAHVQKRRLLRGLPIHSPSMAIFHDMAQVGFPSPANDKSGLKVTKVTSNKNEKETEKEFHALDENKKPKKQKKELPFTLSPGTLEKENAVPSWAKGHRDQSCQNEDENNSRTLSCEGRESSQDRRNSAQEEREIAREYSRMSNRSQLETELAFLTTSPSPCPGCPPNYQESMAAAARASFDADSFYPSILMPDEDEDERRNNYIGLPSCLPPPETPPGHSMATAPSVAWHLDAGSHMMRPASLSPSFPASSSSFRPQLERQFSTTMDQQQARPLSQSRTIGFLERRKMNEERVREEKRKKNKFIPLLAHDDDVDSIPPPPPPPIVSPSRMRPVPCYPNRTPRSKPRAGK